MGSPYWIKLYHEILNDPKMGRLPDRLWRRIGKRVLQHFVPKPGLVG